MGKICNLKWVFKSGWNVFYSLTNLTKNVENIFGLQKGSISKNEHPRTAYYSIFQNSESVSPKKMGMFVKKTKLNDPKPGSKRVKYRVALK